MSAAISVKNMTKMYGTFRGVDSISFDVMPGEVYGFLGPNGAGKSTTIKTILNFMKPTSGSISILGKDSVADSVEVKKNIGYLAGDIALYNTMTGTQLLRYLSSLGVATDWEYVAQLEEQLQAQMDRKIQTLSKGNRQKIGIIQAIMHRPDIVILDEPTSGLDPLMKEVFYSIVLSMRDEGKTALISSHDLAEVQKICSKASFIRGGKIISTENISDMTALGLKNFTVVFSRSDDTKDVSHIPGVEVVQSQKNTVTVRIEGDINPFISYLSKHPIQDITSSEASLEEVFMHYYTQNN